VAETCSEEEGGLDNKLHLRQKYMRKKDHIPEHSQLYSMFYCPTYFVRKYLVRQSERKSLHGRSQNRLEDKVKMDLKHIG
jgi:hypothetical protein